MACSMSEVRYFKRVRVCAALTMAVMIGAAPLERAFAWGSGGGGGGAPPAKETTYDGMMKQPRKELADKQKKWDEKTRQENSQYQPPTGFTIGNPGNMFDSK